MQVEIGNMTKGRGKINNMNRETVIQNLTNNYGKYGITREVLEPLIDDGVAEVINFADYVKNRKVKC